MQLICNVYLSKADKNLIEDYVSNIQTDFLVNLDKLEDELIKDHLRCLGWMLKTGTLEIKIAVLENKPGIQHEKIGIMKDSEDNIISFMGSENETMMGWVGNNEKFHVFRSWISGEKHHLASDVEDFNLYWNNIAKRAVVYPISEAVKKGLIKIAPKSTEELSSLTKKIMQILIERNRAINKPTPSYSEWPHKKIARDIFLNKKHGILEMATGTGKTSVATGIINQLLDQSEINGVIVTTYGNDLLDQWYRELCEKTDSDLVIYRYYGEYHELEDFFINPDYSILLLSWTNLVSVFREKEATEDKLLVCDEVHGFGSEQLRASLAGLINKMKYTLGLSATSEREYDVEGNQFIEREIGPVIFSYDLKDAIKDGILCEFDYIPLRYSFNLEDKQRRQQAYKTYYARINNNENENQSRIELYMALARVRKLSKNKIPIFKNFLKNQPNVLNNCLIFVETMEYGKLIQDEVIKYTSSFHTYYSDDEKENLEKFKDGEFDLLITCKRISQGIDIKSIRNIILFSASRGNLETIQRIGRCLRTNPLDPEKIATVVDFILNEEDQSEDEDRDDTDEKRMNWLTEISKTKRSLI